MQAKQYLEKHCSDKSFVVQFTTTSNDKADWQKGFATLNNTKFSLFKDKNYAKKKPSISFDLKFSKVAIPDKYHPFLAKSHIDKKFNTFFARLESQQISCYLQVFDENCIDELRKKRTHIIQQQLNAIKKDQQRLQLLIDKIDLSKNKSSISTVAGSSIFLKDKSSKLIDQEEKIVYQNKLKELQLQHGNLKQEFQLQKGKISELHQKYIVELEKNNRNLEEKTKNGKLLEQYQKLNRLLANLTQRILSESRPQIQESMMLLCQYSDDIMVDRVNSSNRQPEYWQQNHTILNRTICHYLQKLLYDYPFHSTFVSNASIRFLENLTISSVPINYNENSNHSQVDNILALMN